MTVEDLNPKGLAIGPLQRENLEALAERVSALEIECGTRFTVTSGLRSVEDQQRINPKAKRSAHLTGEAVDIADPDGGVWEWLIDNLELVKQVGIYLEAKAFTPTWCHLQIRPPASGNRVFLP